MAGVLENAALITLDPNAVDEGQRIGFLHEDKAAAIGRLMAVDGQRDPIKVVAQPKNKEKPWRLVTGMHRLIGARIEGVSVIAIEVSGKPEALADLEASENLHRRPLGPIERAKFTAALVLAAQERIAREHGNLTHQQRGIKKRWARVKSGEIRVEQALKDETDDTCATIAQVYGWEESVGEALGMSRRTIHNDLSLFRLLIEPFPDLIEALAKHPIVGENASQLKQIAHVKDEAARRGVIESLIADHDLSADMARASAGLGSDVGAAPAGPAHQKYFNQITGGWSRLGLTQKRDFLPQIAAMVSTPGLKRELRDMLDAELGDEPAPQAAPEPDPADSRAALGRAIGLINSLLDGTGVDDEELEQARLQLQAAAFDFPFEAGSLADALTRKELANAR